MVFGSIGTLIDKIKDLVVEYLNGIAGQINDTIDAIRGDIEKVSGKLDEVKDAVNANNVGGEIQTLNQGVTDIKSGITDGVQGELKGVKDTLDNRFNAVDEKLTTLTYNFNKLFDERNAELERVRAEAAQAETLRATVADKDKQLADKDEQIGKLRADLNSLNEKSDGLSKELTEMDGKLTAAQDELNAERQSSAAAKEALEMWRESVACYAPVRDAMKNCSMFGKLLAERGLIDETDKGLFAFVQELGKTVDFLRDIHQTALDDKKTQAAPALMSKEELAVYEALNDCYRRIWNIDFDVFVTPGERKPVGDDFYKIPFNKDDAIVLKDPRNRSMKFVKGLYVPLLLNREGRMYKQAYVEAVNV